MLHALAAFEVLFSFGVKNNFSVFLMAQHDTIQYALLFL